MPELLISFSLSDEFWRCFSTKMVFIVRTKVFLVLDSSRYRDFEVRHQFMFRIKQRDDAVYMADLKLCLRDLKLQFVNQVSDLESSQK